MAFTGTSADDPSSSTHGLLSRFGRQRACTARAAEAPPLPMGRLRTDCAGANTRLTSSTRGRSARTTCITLGVDARHLLQSTCGASVMLRLNVKEPQKNAEQRRGRVSVTLRLDTRSAAKRPAVSHRANPIRRQQLIHGRFGRAGSPGVAMVHLLKLVEPVEFGH